MCALVHFVHWGRHSPMRLYAIERGWSFQVAILIISVLRAVIIPIEYIRTYQRLQDIMMKTTEGFLRLLRSRPSVSSPWPAESFSLSPSHQEFTRAISPGRAPLQQQELQQWEEHHSSTTGGGGGLGGGVGSNTGSNTNTGIGSGV